MFADIVFPQKIEPLTYSIPDDCPEDLEGRLVEAPLRMSKRFGLILSAAGSAQSTDARLKEKKVSVKPLSAIHETVFTKTHVELLRWLSSYYLSSMGVALSSMFFDDLVLAGHPPASRRKRPGRKTPSADSVASDTSLGTIERLGAHLQTGLVGNALEDALYHAFLLHAPSRLYEHRFLIDLLLETAPAHSGIIVLVPEITRIAALSPSLMELWGSRVCVLHGRLSKRQRADAVKRLAAGEADIILGTRSAILAPLGRASLIIVTEEHHAAYKAEEGLRYHARDVAVMRAFMEKSTVLLSSVSPSLETFHNTMSGKYTLVTDRDYCLLPGSSGDRSLRHPHDHRPDVRIVDLRGQGARSAILPRDVAGDLRRFMGRRERVLILADRKGYSMLRCADCGHLFRCPRCDASLIFSRERSLLRCGRCTLERNVPDSCEACGGLSIEGIGTGTEKLAESLADAFGTEPLVLEKRPVRMRIREVTPKDADNAGFVIGTTFAGRRMKDMSLAAAVLMNVDSLLSQPHFRAYEHAFQEIAEVMALVRSDGRVYLATRMPGNPVVRHLRAHTTLDFLRGELAERAKLGYPPFSRIALISVETKRDLDRTAAVLEKMAGELRSMTLDILGPVAITLPRRKDRRALQFMLKSPDRKTLHEEARRLMSRFQTVEGISVTADVDPLKI